MKSLFRVTLSIAMVWLVVAITACSMFMPSPTPMPTATSTSIPTSTPTPTPFNHAGLWDGGTISDASLTGAIQFFVKDNRVTEISFDYTLRSGGCTLITSMGELVDSSQITGNDFTAQITDSYSKSKLILTGTFTAPTEASGSFEFQGAIASCGDVTKKGKWTANNIPIPPTRTPTITPTATKPRPTITPTRVITSTPSVLTTPVSWGTVRSQRFSIMVPPGFYTQVPLQDVRMKFDTAQLIFMGLDRETGFSVDVTESPAIFHSAQKRMENRKGDLERASNTAILLVESGIKLNGKEAAVLEYTQNDLATVIFYIATDQEEFEITIKQAQKTDVSFIANAERIANSFTIDATPRTPVPTQTPGLPALWTTQKTKRFTLSFPTNLQVTVPLNDVQRGNGGIFFMAEDPQTGYQVFFSQTNALFGTAKGKWENRSNDFRATNNSVKILKSQAGLTLNGHEAAVIEYVRANSVGVEYFIVVGQEEFDLIFRYGMPNDPNFIATAERIVNSFMIDAITTNATTATPTK